MLVQKLNPAYVYGAVADGIALLVGLGLITLTDVQDDLVLKFVAGVILLVTGVAVPAARSNNERVEAAFAEDPNANRVVRI